MYLELSVSGTYANRPNLTSMWLCVDRTATVIAWYSEGHSAPLARTFTGIFGRETKTNMFGE